MRKSYFTLIEVLIAMTLVLFALPFLFTPFVLSIVDLKESVAQNELSFSASMIEIAIFEELHQGAYATDAIENGSYFPLLEEWKSFYPSLKLEGRFRFKPIKKASDEEKKAGNLELIEMELELVDEKTKSKRVEKIRFVLFFEENRLLPEHGVSS